MTPSEGNRIVAGNSIHEYRSAALSHCGVVRQINEDAVLSMPENGLWVIADGMGGHEAGDIASKIVVDVLEKGVLPTSLSDSVDAVERFLEDANKRIQEYSELVLDNKTVGTTVVVFIVRGKLGVCLWVGDSRLYGYRDGVLDQLTTDHSRVAELVEQGLILPEQAQSHPESNIITRAIGAFSELYIDNFVFEVERGDTYLLCSDGLYNCLSNEEIAEQLRNSDVTTGVEGLIQRALDNGAPDNVSVIVTRYP